MDDWALQKHTDEVIFSAQCCSVVRQSDIAFGFGDVLSSNVVVISTISTWDAVLLLMIV